MPQVGCFGRTSVRRLLMGPLGAPKEVDEDEYDPTNNKKSKQKKKQKAVVPSSENPRANAHTLNEDLSHLLSGSFDTSFSNDRSGGLADPFSSQVGDIFGFEDNLLGAPHDLDLSIGDIGDELARELGEGWGATDFLRLLGELYLVQKDPDSFLAQ